MRKAIATWIAQAIKFGLVGVVNTLLDWGVFALLAFAPFFAENYVATKAISYSCGLVNSLWLNRRYTFRDKQRMSPDRLAMFLGVNLTALGASLAAIALLKTTGLDVRVCNILSTALSLAINFLGSKLLVFRDPPRSKPT